MYGINRCHSVSKRKMLFFVLFDTSDHDVDRVSDRIIVRRWIVEERCNFFQCTLVIGLTVNRIDLHWVTFVIEDKNLRPMGNSSLPILSIILPIIRVPAGQESSQTSKNDFCGYRIVFKGKNNKKPNGCEPLGFLSWRLCRDSNPDLTLRRGLFYPVELQRRTVFKLSVFASECLSGPQL